MAKILPFLRDVFLLTVFISLLFSTALAQGELFGKVLDDNGRPLAAVEITAMSVGACRGSTRFYYDITDSSGNYDIKYMCLSHDNKMRYLVVPYKQGYYYEKGAADVEVSETATELDIIMKKEANSSIGGYVYYSNSKIANARVVLKNKEKGIDLFNVTSQEGLYNISSLEAGNYEIQASYNNLYYASSVDLPEDTDLRFDITLKEALPDIVLKDFTIEEELEQGEATEISYEIANEGHARSSSFTVKIYDGDELIEEEEIGGLDVNEKTKISFDYEFYDIGRHEIKVVLDADNDVVEENEDNNEYVFYVNVKEGHGAYLKPYCDVKTDSYGYTEIRARAGYYENGGFYCYGSNVTAKIKDFTYELHRHYNCDYSKLVLLPIGTYKVEFNAEFPNGKEEKDYCHITVGNQSQLELMIDSPANNSEITPSSKLDLVAHLLLLGNVIREGNLTVTLKRGSVEVEKTELHPDKHGFYRGSLDIPDKEALYELVFDYEKKPWTKESKIYLNVSAAARNISLGRAMKIDIISPKAMTYEIGENMSISVRVYDSRASIITDANLSARIFRGNVEIDRVSIPYVKYVYVKPYNFTGAGNYKIIIEAKAASLKASAERRFTISKAALENISQEGPLRVDIISPKSDVYPENSSIMVLAKVSYEGDPVNNANVTASFGGRLIQMRYHRFGEYVAVLPPRETGRYELWVQAEYNNYSARDKVEFMLSKNLISVRVKHPENNSALNFTDGQKLLIRADVLDIRGDVVVNAEVITHIREPTGRVHEMRAFQDPNTGEYITIFYPNDNGVYHISITASKPGYVSGVQESSFTITFREKSWLAAMTWKTLLTLLLLMGIILILLAIVKGLLF
ncbi:hypothetical protein DRN74_03495 [Candidatus Micrarchaeota archaeon]|nr:MAG: hypothetical protein DRN74_03495 [Candidatus Micrarchaeota archaeon]